MTDMLVKLYDLPSPASIALRLDKEGIRFLRAMTLDRQSVLQFVKDEFWSTCPGWVDECDASLLRQPGTCFIAVKEERVIGFACYDGSAKGFIGPVGVATDCRRKGVAQRLLLEVCEAMRSDGYGYAVLGWVSSQSYYAKALNALVIPDSLPGVYAELIVPPSR